MGNYESPVEPPLTARAPQQPALEPEAGRAVAGICRSRALLWHVLAAVMAEPTAEHVELLRSGELHDRLGRAITWLGPEAKRFTDATLALGMIARRADRTDPEEMRTDLAQQFGQFFGEGAPFAAERLVLLDAAADLADSCRREALAWEAGDAELAKELRVQQAALIEGSLVDLIPEWAHQIDYVAKHPYVRMCARLSVSVLTVESGRDFDHTVFGWVAQDDA